MDQNIRKVLARKPLVIALAAVLLYTLAGFFAAPAILQWRLPLFAQQNLHCQASVDTIRINPFLLSIEVEGFSLKQADGAPLVAFSRLFADLEMSSLFRWAIVLQELALDKPDIHVAMEPDGSLNFERFAAAPPQPTAPDSPGSPSLPVLVHNTTIQEGRITFVDKRQSDPANVAFQGISLRLQDITTIKDQAGTYHLAATTANDEAVQVEGEGSLFPLRAKGTVTLNGIRLTSLWQYIRDSLNLDPPEGKIDLSAGYLIDTTAQPAQVALEGIRIATSNLSLKMRGTDNAFFRLQKAEVSAPRFDLATSELHVSRLLLEQGAVDVRINESGNVNMQQIVNASPSKHHHKTTQPPPPPPAQPTPTTGQKQISPPPAASSPLKLQVDAFEIRNLAIDLDDKSRKVPFKAAVAGADLHMRANLELGGKQPAIVLHEMATELRGVKVLSSKIKDPLFATEKITVEGGSLNMAARSASIARVALHKGRMDAGREADGTINWQQLLQIKGTGAQTAGQKSAPSAAPGWKFLVKSFEMDGFASKFSDLTTRVDKPVFSVQNLTAKLTGIDGTSPMGFTAGFQIEEGGTATVSGTVHPALPAVEADVNLTGVALASLQPYLEPYVTLKMQSAQVSARGRLGYGLPKRPQQAVYEGSFSLNNLRLIETGSKKPFLSWDALQLPQCKLTLQPTRLETREIILSKPVGEIIIGDDHMLNFARVVKKQPPGSTSKPAAKPAAKSTKQQGGQDDFTYQVSRLRVENGNIVFADLSLRPQFMTRIHDLKGTIAGLSSVKEAQATVQMDGQVDQYGTAKITGLIRPSDFGRASDFAMVFRNLEMKNLSPYSGKFAGRLIKSGKFSADLNYKLHDYKMTGENKIVIDNLSLGDKVEDTAGGNLPLDLAIALLTDSNGRIDIGLPVTGDLDDPQFSIGSLIWKMFTNLITKATTAPFRALGSLLGGDSEKFDAVTFDPGSHTLMPPEKEKLLKLAEALKSRPQLKLVIQGRYSPEADGLELRERSIRRTVATRQGARLSPDDPPDALDFADSGTRKSLEKLYEERFGKASLEELDNGIAAGKVTPRMPAQNQGKRGKESGMFAKMTASLSLHKIIPGGRSPEQSALWAGELYTRLVEQEKVADKTLLQLAENRAQAIATHLEGQNQIPKDRVGVKAPEPFTGNEPPAVTLSLDAL